MTPTKTVIAHRGLSGGEPENTTKAFAASVIRGVEAIELDVRETADRVLVVWHDAIAGGASIARSTHRQLASRVTELCTFREALDVIPPECLLDVEVKVAGVEMGVLHELQLRRKKGEFVVTSFHDEVVARVKALDPTVRVGLVLGEGRPKEGMRARLSEFFPVGRLRQCDADLVVASRRLVRFGFLRRVARLGYPVWVWTVNEPRLMRVMFRRPEVAAFITDRPLEAMALRAALGSSGRLTSPGVGL